MRDSTLALEFERADEEERAGLLFKPEDIRVGTELEVKGEYNGQTGELKAKSVKVHLDEYQHVKRTALLENAPQLTRVGPTWAGSLRVDGQRVVVNAVTVVTIKPNSSQKKAAQQAKKVARKSATEASVATTDDAAGEALMSTEQIKPNMFVLYDGIRQRDGSILAKKLEFTKNELTKAEADLWKTLTPKIKQSGFANGKPGEIQIHQVGKFKLVPNSEVQKYVQDLGMSLVPAIQRDLPPGDPNKIPFQFFVVEQKVPNAFALANGTVVVHSGILTLLENEAQLAAVLGHEIAHATQEHTYRQLQYHQKELAALRIGAAVAAAYGKRNLANLATLAEAAIRNGYARSLENQADRIGMEYMIAAGYDPREAPRVWKVMAQKLGDHPTNFFWSNHDNNTTRRSYLMSELKNNYDTLDFDSYKHNSDGFSKVAGSLKHITITPGRQNPANAATKKASESLDRRAEVRQVPMPQSLAVPSSRMETLPPQSTAPVSEDNPSARLIPPSPVQQPPTSAATAAPSVKETAPSAPKLQDQVTEHASSAAPPSPTTAKPPSPTSPMNRSTISQLVIESLPSGASVTMNGSLVGQTPVQITGPAGLGFSLRIEKEGYETYNVQTFSMPAENSSSLKATLRPTNPPDELNRFITERVILSVPRAPSAKDRARSPTEEQPENGTEFLYTTRRGAGTIRISNELDADAVMQLMTPAWRQFRVIYVRRHMEAAVVGIPAGTYVVTYTVGSGWQKGNLMKISGSGNVGALEFLQIDSASGVKADRYQIRLTAK